MCFAFSLEGSVFPKGVAWALPCSMVTFCLHFIIRIPAVKEILPWMDVGASILGNFTLVLGFLIVFRVNQAYSRWWEGGTLLQKIRGDWFNAYSSLLAFCNEEESQRLEVDHFKHTLARLISLLYSNAIHQVSTADPKVFECIDIDGLSPEHVVFMEAAHNRCEVILQWIQKLIVEANKKELIKIAPPILSRVYNQLGDGIVDLNNAQKIAEFPIPFPLAQMVTIMLLYHIFLTCTVCAFSIQNAFWALMISFVIIFAFQSINYIAVELEGPFGDDPNDLPLPLMAQDMNTSLITLLADHAMTVPPTLNLEDRHRDLIVKSVDFDSELGSMAAGRLADRTGRRCKPVSGRIQGDGMNSVSTVSTDPNQVSARSDVAAESISTDRAASSTAKSKPLEKGKDSEVVIPVKKAPEPVETECGNAAQPKAVKTQELNPRPQSNGSSIQSTDARVQASAPQSVSRDSKKPAAVTPVKAQSTETECGEGAILPPVGTQKVSKQELQLEASPEVAAVDAGTQKLSAGAGLQLSSSSSASEPVSRPDTKQAATRLEASKVEASRQMPQLNGPRSAVQAQAEVDMASFTVGARSGGEQYQKVALPAGTQPAVRLAGQMQASPPVAIDTVARDNVQYGECRKKAAELPANFESVEGERDETASRMPVGGQIAGIQGSQLQVLRPAATDSASAGRETAQTALLVPLVTQSAGSESAQTAPLLSGSNPKFGGEREQNLALLSADRDSDYVSDWL